MTEVRIFQRFVFAPAIMNLPHDRVEQAHVRNDIYPKGDDQAVAGIAGDTLFGVPGKSAEQIKAGVFPLRLASGGWKTGIVSPEFKDRIGAPCP